MLAIEQSLTEAVGQLSIVGDFDSESLDWEETRLDKGIIVNDIVDKNDLCAVRCSSYARPWRMSSRL